MTTSVFAADATQLHHVARRMDHRLVYEPNDSLDQDTMRAQWRLGNAASSG